MIVRVKEGYQVVSTKGKNLGGPYKTLEEAKKRLREVEFFKHRKADRGEGGDGANDSPRPSNLCRACPVLGVDGADPAEPLSGIQLKRQARPLTPQFEADLRWIA